MGKLIYGSHGREFEFDDRLLAHLQTVILSKLRRGEAFAFEFDRPVELGSGRSTLWLHQAVELEFSFHGSRRPALSRPWVEELIATANSAQGLRILPEPSNA